MHAIVKDVSLSKVMEGICRNLVPFQARYEYVQPHALMR